MEFDPDQENNTKNVIDGELNNCIHKLKQASEIERIKLIKYYVSLKFKIKDFKPDEKLGFDIKEYIFKVDREATHLLVALVSCVLSFDIKWLSRLNITSDD